MVDAYRSRKGAKALTSASQRKRSTVPENRAGSDRSTEKRSSEGRARLCGDALVGSCGVGGRVPTLFGCEPIEVVTVCDGEGSRGVCGVSGIEGEGDGDGAGTVSGAREDEGEGGRAGDWGGTTWAGEL